MILVTSDWQLTDNPRDDYRHQWQTELRSLVKEHAVQCVVMLGDITEEKDHHGAGLVNQVVNHLDKLRQLCKVVILQGNHDYVDVNSPFYQFVSHISGIEWISKPMEAGDYVGHVCHLHELAFTGLGKILFLPHTTNWKKDWAGIPLKKYDLVFAHQTFEGVTAESGFKLKGVPVEQFKHNWVISGDVHKPQDVGSNITYVGSPYLCDFGDDFEPRVLLLSKAKNHPEAKLARLSLPCTGPQKRLLDIVSLKDLKPGSRATRKLNKGDIIKVRMYIGREQHAEWPELRESIREWGEKQGYLVHVVQPVLEAERARGTVERKTVDKKSDEEVIKNYAKRRALDDLTLKAGLNIARKI
jgi:hypothetical protein